jgi:hypothetical protein
MSNIKDKRLKNFPKRFLVLIGISKKLINSYKNHVAVKRRKDKMFLIS